MPPRDTAGDVGTAISTASEGERRSAAHVLPRNCKRVEESLRSLEEYGKLIDARGSGDDRAAALPVLHARESPAADAHKPQARLAECRLYLLSRRAPAVADSNAS